MTSRLCKIILVNAKTSGSNTSGRFSEIDPRGGAAITGSNGAGKTTTLQLVPLFFGASPNQLVQAGGNLESMLRFILPHPESAIVFEYNRSDSASDLCHVILRREPSSDVGEYRFVRGSMRKDFFVAQDANGDTVFLDDEGTRQVASRLGMGDDFGAKLKLAAYRSVILNVPSAGKDNIHRRQLAARFSFSRKPLPHLDRLVAAVIKEHLDFEDFAEVAATIVMEKIGVDKGQSAKDKQLQLRQSRGQIEQWLRDRDAIERAIQLEPEVKSLRDLIDEFRALDLSLGQKRSDCKKLTAINAEIKEEAEAALQELEKRKESLVEQFADQKSELEGAISQARETFNDKSNAYESQLSWKRYLEEQDAAQWAQKTLELEGLKGETTALKALVEAIRSTANDVVTDFENRVHAVERETSIQVEVMGRERGVASQRYDAEVAALDDQERQGQREIATRFEPQQASAKQKVETCIEALSDAKAHVRRPSLDPHLEERIAKAQVTFNEHQDSVIAAQKAYGEAVNTMSSARRSWEQAQRLHSGQKEHLSLARERVAALKSQLQPQKDSLHAALLDASEGGWAENLAKILDPQLLKRTDLQPHFAEEGDALAYGWGLDLEAIARPAWVDQDDIKRKLEEATSEAEIAQGLLDEEVARFHEAGALQEAAEKEVNLKQAALNVVLGKSGEHKALLNALQETAGKALDNAKADATRKLLTAEEDLQKSRANDQSLETERKHAEGGLRTEFVEQKIQAKVRRDKSIDATNSRIDKFRIQQQEAIRLILDERDKDLKAKGVDGAGLSAKEGQLRKLRERIGEIEDHGAIARDWNSWQNDQGPSRLVDAEGVRDRAERALSEAQGVLTAAEKQHRDTIGKLGQEATRINQRFETAQKQISILRNLAVDLDEFAPYGISVVTEDVFAETLKGETTVLLDNYRRKSGALRTKFEKVERSLCESDSSTKDFVQGVMREAPVDAQTAERASALVRVYGRIRSEVLVNVNLSLRTMLDGIKHYRGIISDFESEVTKFNNRLQEGLRRVSSKFERFKDFKVHVVTDLDKIDFVGKLKLLDGVIADHRARNAATYSIEIPPVQSAQALRSFMGALSAGTMEINLGKHITLSGSVIDDGVLKEFHSAKELEKISSNGLSAIALISLLSGLLNVIRGEQDIYVPWATDEVGRFDGSNFQHLMQMMSENKIDAITASPALTPASYAYFAHRYVFKPQGVIAEYRARSVVHQSFNAGGA